MSDKIDKNIFKNPPAEFRSIPFWSWNCRVTKELIDEQLDCFKKMGFGGVDIHPRVGLDNEYLGDEYMELIKYTADKCKEKGLICWLYDDDRFPSGAADGIVTKNVRYRDRGLFLTLKKNNIYLKNKTEFEKAIDNGKKPKGYFLCAYALEFNDGILTDYERLNTNIEIENAAKAGKTIRYAYVKLASESESFEGQTYVDTLNKQAIDEFIRVTHNRYNDYVGTEFGKTVQAIFTDEPRIGKQTQIESALSDEDFEIPYSEYFDEFLKDNYDVNMLDIVPELVWDMPNSKGIKNRHTYRNALTECFAKNYMDNICDWCKEHNILMTGHILSETPLIHQSATVGECMRTYRNMDIPGIDILCDDHSFVTVKQAVSVSKQMGRQGTMSELYGVTNWDCTFKTYKLQGDWQAALGITIRVPHLSFMSMAGEGKRDWPASIFYQSPWYKEFTYIEDYFSRVNYFLSKGKPVTRVAIIHPIESIWLHLGQKDRNESAINKLQSDFANITETLLFGGIDVDYISESLLPEQYKNTSDTFKVGEMEYDAVIIPSMETIRKTTLDRLEQFHKNGGKVIFAGDIPLIMDAEKSARASNFAKDCETVEISGLLTALENEKDIKITREDGSLSDNLFYQLRSDGEIKRLFICNVKGNKTVHEKYTIRIKGSYSAVKYNALSGKIQPVHNYTEKGITYVIWNAYSEDSILLEFSKNCTDNDDEKECSLMPVAVIKKPNTVEFDEKNVLLLDYTKYSLDKNKLSERMEILKADDDIRAKLGFSKRSGRMRQPYATDEKEYHNLKLHYEINSEIETGVELGIELPPKCSIYLNGENVKIQKVSYYVDNAISVITLPNLKQGKNELIVEMEFNQKTNIENMYLLGDFSVEISGNNTVIKKKHNIMSFGDITAQGAPFYTGNIDYTFDFVAKTDSEYFIHIPEFNAPIITVCADNKNKEIIAYSPHRTSLGYLKKGTHKITIRLYGNRFNGFGMLHNANRNFKWLGPAAYRTSGEEWTDCYMIRPVGIMSDIIIERI